MSASLIIENSPEKFTLTLEDGTVENWRLGIYDGHQVDDLYVSDRGRMRRGRYGQITRGSASYGDGRLKQMMVCIKDHEYKWGFRCVNLHRIVLETFTGVKWVKHYQVDHINHDVSDGRVDNLRMVSCKENNRNRRLREPRFNVRCPRASLFRYNQCLKYGVKRLQDLPRIIFNEYHRIRMTEHRERLKNAA